MEQIDSTATGSGSLRDRTYALLLRMKQRIWPPWAAKLPNYWPIAFAGLILFLCALQLVVSNPPPLTLAAVKGDESAPLRQDFKRYCEAKALPCRIDEMDYDELRTQELASLGSQDTPRYDILMVDDPWLEVFRERRQMMYHFRVANSGDFQGATLKCARLGDGTYLGVPYVANTQVLAFVPDLVKGCCRQDARDNVKLDTWDDVLDCAQRVKDRFPDSYGYVLRGAGRNPLVTDLLPILWAFDRGLSFDNVHLGDDADAAVWIMLRLAGVAPDSYMGFGDFEVSASLATKRAAIGIVWSNAALLLRKANPRIEFRPVPTADADGTDPKPELGVWLLAIPKLAANRDDALAFIEKVTSTEGLARAFGEGNPPARASVFRDPSDDLFVLLQRSLSQAVPRLRSPRWDQIRTLLKERMTRFHLEWRDRSKGSKGIPSDALAKLRKAINEDLSSATRPAQATASAQRP